MSSLCRPLLPFFSSPPASSTENPPASAHPLAQERSSRFFLYIAQFYNFQTAASPRSLAWSATTKPLAAETEHASDRTPKSSAIAPCIALLLLLFLRIDDDLAKKAKAGGSTKVAGAKARAPTSAMQTEKKGSAAAAAATRAT